MPVILDNTTVRGGCQHKLGAEAGDPEGTGDALSETNIENSTLALQDFGTRAYPVGGSFTSGNQEAAAWLYSQLDAIEGLSVAYQSAHNNVVATLSGDSTVYIVGAHYDDRPFTGSAPGASDNGVGVAMVLEMARILSQYEFEHTLATQLHLRIQTAGRAMVILRQCIPLMTLSVRPMSRLPMRRGTAN